MGLWYQIDPGDADPATFFYYLGQAARRASPHKRRRLPLLTPEYLPDLSTFARRYFENLNSLLRPTGVMVFDNYHEVHENSPLHEVMLQGLSSAAEGINVILVSRSNPPPALVRLRANHLMEMVGWNELRLTPGESQAMVRLRAKQKIPKETIHRLHSMVDGWAAGLVLMLEGLKTEGIEPHVSGGLTPEEIFEYFGNELFDKTDQELREFLLKTALLPKMTAKMAEELTGRSSAHRILSSLSRDNYFTEKRFYGDPIY